MFAIITNMKLKIYRTLLLASLFIAVAANTFFLVMTVIDMIPAETKDDYIMFLICFLVAIAFSILEISNTFRSFKEGSSFVKPLMYDDDDSKNNKGIVIMSVIFIIGLALLVFGILGSFHIRIQGLSLPNGFYYLISSVGAIASINGLFSLLFLLTGKQDLSFSKKKRKKEEW